MKMKKSLKSVLSVVLVTMMLVSIMAPMASAVSFDKTALGSDTYLTSKTDYTVAPGITETHVTTNNKSGSNQVQGYALEVDLTNPTVSVVASYKDYDPSKGWGMQKVRDQAYAAEKKLGVNVVAGVNGDFYNMNNGAPTGTFVMNGTTYNENNNWNYFAILKDGTPIIGSGKLDTSNVKECVGGPAVILKNSKLTWDAYNNGYGTAVQPRTAVGITAEGKIILYVADGRQAPTSCGQKFVELAKAMLALGCVDALCLDGGGSSTFISQHEGEDELVCRNSPADGSERTVSSALLVCSSAKPDGEFSHATLTPNNEVYTPDSTVQFTAKGVDSSGYAAELPSDGKFELATTDMGTITTDGSFTSNGTTGTVTVNYVSAGAVCGTVSIEIQKPDSIYFTNEEINLGFSAKSTLGLQVKYQNRTVNYKDGDIVWSLSDNKMGEFNGNTFVSSDSESINGTITATSAYDSNVKGSIAAAIGKLPSVIWDFEDTDDYKFGTVEFEANGGKIVSYGEDCDNSTTMYQGNYGRGSTMNATIVSNDDGEVRFGSNSLKFEFDFTADKTQNQIEGACFGAATASEAPDGTPTALGLWVYVPEGTPNYWLRIRVKCGEGEIDDTNSKAYIKTLDFNSNFNITKDRGNGIVEGTGGFDWTGWKYVEVDLSDCQAPITFISGETIRFMNTPANKTDFYTFIGTDVDENGNTVNLYKYLAQSERKGYVYIDNVQYVYGANTDDINNPIIDSIQIGNEDRSDLTEIGSSTVFAKNDVLIKASFHDYEDKYSTDINYDACRLYIDGKDVTSKLKTVDGDFYYTGKLADGTHSVKLIVRDGFNNATTETRYFTIDSSKSGDGTTAVLPTVKIEAASDTCVIGSNFSLNVTSNAIDDVETISTEIKLDRDIVKSEDDITVKYADGFTGKYSYDATTGILTLNIKKTSKNILSVNDFETIATVTIKIPSDLGEGKSFTFRTEKGEIGFSDETIETDTFAANSSVTASATYAVTSDVMIVGSTGKFYVKDTNGTPVANVDVFNQSNNVKIGTTDENGEFEYNGFCSTAQAFVVYAAKDGSYSFGYSSQSLMPACESDGTPTYVHINATTDGNTQKNISWLTNPLVNRETYVQYKVVGASEYTTVKGTSSLQQFLLGSSADKNYAVRVNNVVLQGLEENTEYVYRVGDGNVWSTEKTFKTSLNNSKTNFFIFGDIQAQDTTNVSNLLSAVANDELDYDFGIQTGDSVEGAGVYTDWQDILSVFANDNIASTDMIHVLGNHEYMGDLTGGNANAIYATPDDDYYSVEYGNVYVAVINFRENTKVQIEESIEWLKTDAAASNATWKILTVHTPAYGTNSQDPQKNWQSLLPAAAQEVGIDFVFSGHDHSYARTAPMVDGEVDENGVVYFICGSSGEKSYGVTVNDEYNFEIADNEYTSIYISVSTTDDTATVNVYDVNGNSKTLYDSYTKTIETECSKDGHKFLHKDGWFTCSVCGYVQQTEDFTGFVNDAKTGSTMYFIGGEYVTGWFSFGTDHYYFDKKGLATTGKVTLNGHTYTFGADGKMTKGSLEKNSDDTYTYYINGEKQRGWFEIDGDWYYFSRTNGYKTFKGEKSVNGMKYTFSNSGKLIKGAWNTTNQGTCYYWGPTPVTGLQTIDGYTYYFDPTDTYMLVNESVEIDGDVYAFGSDGKFAHMGEHSDKNGDGKCDTCQASKVAVSFLQQIIDFFNQIKMFFLKLFK